MGITELIPFLKKHSTTSRVHLKDLQGSTVAVDTYCWLHKGVSSCAEELVRGEETDAYVQYCLRYVHMMLSYNIKPILVFDGRHLPAKALTEEKRRESREQSRKCAAELLRLGQIYKARSHMRRCVDITHDMALRLIRECRVLNVDCIVAPYEADAQMAWLNKVDLAQYVITEDSDLTVFGARKVIFKLDLTGSGLLVEADKFFLAMECRQERFTFEKFRQMCILSGCDYLDSLPGIGLVKARKFVMMTEETDMRRALKKIPQYLKMPNLEVDDEYIENFLKAEATFKHMFIYNPLKRKMERLYDLKEFETDERYCSNAGTLIEDDETAFQLALGNLNPFDLKQLDTWHPDSNQVMERNVLRNGARRSNHDSIWQKNFKPHLIKKNIGKKFDSTESSSCGIYKAKLPISIDKRSVFNSGEEYVGTSRTIEVQSRFFDTNVRLVTQMQLIQPNSERRQLLSEDLTNDINKIEKLSQQQEENQMQLYNQLTPSPKKQINRKSIDNEIVLKVSEDNQRTEENFEYSQASFSQSSEEINDVDSIMLSDNDGEDFGVDALKNSEKNIVKVQIFNSKRVQRIGLCNPQKSIAKRKNTSKATTSSVQEPKQMRLTMFGFKKRSTLK